MSPPWLSAYQSMMRVISSQESMLQIRVHQIGAGVMKKGDASASLRRWTRDASRHPVMIESLQQRRENSAMELMKAGFKIEIVPRKGEKAKDA